MSFKEVAYPDLLGSTMQLMKKDSFLFINEFHGDSLIHIFNLKTAQKEGNLVASGNGPNELISPLELQIVDDNLWVLSRQLHLLNHIPFSALDENPVLLKDGLIKSEADCFIPLDENRIVFSGFFNQFVNHLFFSSPFAFCMLPFPVLFIFVHDSSTTNRHFHFTVYFFTLERCVLTLRCKIFHIDHIRFFRVDHNHIRIFSRFQEPLFVRCRICAGL